MDLISGGTHKIEDHSKSEHDDEDDSPNPIEAEVKVSDMFNKTYFKAFWIGCVLSLVQQLSGINAVVFYSNDLFKGDSTGIDGEKAA